MNLWNINYLNYSDYAVAFFTSAVFWLSLNVFSDKCLNTADHLMK